MEHQHRHLACLRVGPARRGRRGPGNVGLHARNRPPPNHQPEKRRRASTLKVKSEPVKESPCNRPWTALPKGKGCHQLATFVVGR